MMAPDASICFCTSLSSIAVTVASCSRLITGSGVPFGAMKLNQVEASRSLKPCSHELLTFGSIGARSLVSTAIALTVLPSTSGTTEPVKRADVIDAAADDVLHRRAAAAIGHVGDVDADGGVEQLAVDHAGRARAGRGDLHRRLVLFHVVDELRHGVGRKFIGGDENGRLVGDQHDRHKIFEQVVGRLLVERLVDGVGAGAHHDGVAVRRRLRDARGADHAAGAADILDDDLLAQHLGNLAGDDAGRARRCRRRRRIPPPGSPAGSANCFGRMRGLRTAARASNGESQQSETAWNLPKIPVLHISTAPVGWRPGATPYQGAS